MRSMRIAYWKWYLHHCEAFSYIGNQVADSMSRQDSLWLDSSSCFWICHVCWALRRWATLGKINGLMPSLQVPAPENIFQLHCSLGSSWRDTKPWLLLPQSPLWDSQRHLPPRKYLLFKLETVYDTYAGPWALAIIAWPKPHETTVSQQP